MPLVWKRGSEWGHHPQPPEDSALQIRPCMQEVFLLPIHHFRGHPVPQTEELPTFSRGRSQWVILISITTGTKYARSTFPPQESAWRMWGRTQCLSVHLIRDTYTPAVWTCKEDQREDPPPTNSMHTDHLNLPTHGLVNCCHLWIQDCLPCSWKVQLPNVKCIRS